MTHGLALWQQTALVLLFVLVILIAIWWRFPASPSLRVAAITPTDSATSLPAPPQPITPPSLTLPARPAPSKDIDIHIEVLDVAFQEHPSGPYGAAFGRVDGWYMLFQLRITNRGTSDATVTHWKLQPIVGSRTSWFTVGDTSLAQIPSAWYVEKQPTHYGADPIKIEIERPTLDQRIEREPLKPRIPQTGWVLFDMATPGNIAGPHNAEYDFELRDSMGGVHKHEELPKWTVRSCEIKSAPGPEGIAMPGADLAAVLRGKTPGPQQPPSTG